MIFLDLDKEVQFLMEKSGCTEEQAYGYVDSVDAFYDSKGLIDSDADPETMEEHTEPYDGAPVIENDEMVAFIAERTGLDIELVEQLSMYELEYLESIGIAGEA
jgi:hypothetical protein